MPAAKSSLAKVRDIVGSMNDDQASACLEVLQTDLKLRGIGKKADKKPRAKKVLAEAPKEPVTV